MKDDKSAILRKCLGEERIDNQSIRYAVYEAMQEYSSIQVKQALSKLPEALEIQYHAKRLNETEFREYLDEYLKSLNTKP